MAIKNPPPKRKLIPRTKSGKIILSLAVIVFAVTGAYALYRTYAAGSYATHGYFRVYVRDVHNKSAGVPNVKVQVATIEGGACSNGGAGTTNSAGYTDFMCRGVNSPNHPQTWYGKFAVGFTYPAGYVQDAYHGGYAEGTVFAIRTDSGCYNDAQGRPHGCYTGPDGTWQTIANQVNKDSDRDGVMDHNDACQYTAAKTANGCPPPPPPPKPPTSTPTRPPAQPTPAPSPRPTSPPSRPTGQRAPARPAPAPANPQTPADKTPPGLPGGFTAVQDQDKVKLSWGAATDNVGVTTYKLERSTDQANWTAIGGDIKGTTFDDDTIADETKYYYRVAAYDAAGNGGEFAQVELTTAKLEPNAKLGESFSVESDDKLIKVEFDGGTFDTEAFCSVFITDENRDKLKKIAIGPYKIECKDKDDNLITSFKKPAHVAMYAPEGVNIVKIEVYGLSSENAEKLESNLNEQGNAQRFDLNQPGVVAGVEKSSSLWWLWLIFFLVLLAIIIYRIWAVRRRRSEEAAYSDYAPTSTEGQLPTSTSEYPWEKVDDNNNQPPQPPTPPPAQPPTQPPQ